MRLLTPGGILQRLDSRLRLLVDSEPRPPRAPAHAARDDRVVDRAPRGGRAPAAVGPRRLLGRIHARRRRGDRRRALVGGRARSTRSTALVDGSLVSQSDVDGEPVFSMLATVREYAVERLDERGEERSRCATRTPLHRRAHPAARARARRCGSARGRAPARPGARATCAPPMRHLVDIGNADLRDRHRVAAVPVLVAARVLQRGRRVDERAARARAADASPHARAVARFFDLWSRCGRSTRRAEVVAGLRESADLFARDRGRGSARRWPWTTKGFAQIALEQPDRRRHRTARATARRRCTASGDGWGEALALIALGRVSMAQGATRRGARAVRGGARARPRRAATPSRRRSPAITSPACGCSRGDTDVAARGFRRHDAASR